MDAAGHATQGNRIPLPLIGCNSIATHVSTGRGRARLSARTRDFRLLRFTAVPGNARKHARLRRLRFDKISSIAGGSRVSNVSPRRLRQLSLGLLLDMVPNHMGAALTNGWWLDVLEHGRNSRYAGFFDINWKPETGRCATRSCFRS